MMPAPKNHAPLDSTKAKSMAAAKAAKSDPQALTAGMRNAKRAKLLLAVDPKNELSEAERNRRADLLLKSQMMDLAYKRQLKRKAHSA